MPDAGGGRADTLLGWLQADLRANAAPTPTTRAGRVLAADDRSVQVHACHGAARQVEVLREVLVGLLEDDPTLEPRDILVMCPDIETYAPLFSAAFGLGEAVGAGTPTRPTGCGCGSPTGGSTSTNPLLASPPRWSSSPGAGPRPARCSTWPRAEPVRERFGLSDDDLAAVTGWVERRRRPLGARRGAAGRRSRWRFPPEHLARRARPDPPRRRDGGDDHRHLGARRCRSTTSAAPPSTSPGGSPSSSTGSSRASTRCPGRAPLGEWVDALRDGVRPSARSPRDDAWQLAQFERELARPSRRRRAATASTLRLADVRALLAAGWAAGRRGPTSAPAPSRSARWCRCARCRTAWSAWSGSTTASSRAASAATATTCWPATR